MGKKPDRTLSLFSVFVGCVWYFADDNAAFKWRENDGVHQCNVRVVDAGGLSIKELLTEIQHDRAAPLLLRSAMVKWEVFAVWHSRREFLRRYGHINVGIGVGFRISTNPNNDGLLESWSRSGSHTREKDRARQLRRRFEAQTSAGTAPTLTLRELSAHVRNGDLPHDAYTFAPVDDTALANVSELHQLWRMLGDIEARDDDHAMGTLFGLGGRNSGIMFHRHMSAVSALFAGHKRWLIYDDALHAPDRAFLNRQMQEARRRDPKFRLDSIESWIAHILPLPEVQAWWHRAGWDCVQRAGDLLYVPQNLHHATLNLDEALSLSVQASK